MSVRVTFSICMLYLNPSDSQEEIFDRNNSGEIVDAMVLVTTTNVRIIISVSMSSRGP